MLEIINTVALLCQLHAGGTAYAVNEEQTSCQAELLWCVGAADTKLSPAAALSGCIVKRSVKHDWWKPDGGK